MRSAGHLAKCAPHYPTWLRPCLPVPNQKWSCPAMESGSADFVLREESGSPGSGARQERSPSGEKPRSKPTKVLMDVYERMQLPANGPHRSGLIAVRGRARSVNVDPDP